MTLIVTFHTNEGIVVASDSRHINIRQTVKKVGWIKTRETISEGTFITDYAQKTFLMPNNIALSVCGVSRVDDNTVSCIVKRFIEEHTDHTMKELATGIKDLITDKFGNNKTRVLLSGYENRVGILANVTYRIDSDCDKIKTESPIKPTPIFDGEDEIMKRLTCKMTVAHEEGKKIMIGAIPSDFPYDIYTLQDAINFCQYAIRTTEETMKLRRQTVTVGGPIDILLIRKDGAEWISKKHLFTYSSLTDNIIVES